MIKKETIFSLPKIQHKQINRQSTSSSFLSKFQGKINTITKKGQVQSCKSELLRKSNLKTNFDINFTKSIKSTFQTPSQNQINRKQSSSKTFDQSKMLRKKSQPHINNALIFHSKQRMTQKDFKACVPGTIYSYGIESSQKHFQKKSDMKQNYMKLKIQNNILSKDAIEGFCINGYQKNKDYLQFYKQLDKKSLNIKKKKMAISFNKKNFQDEENKIAIIRNEIYQRPKLHQINLNSYQLNDNQFINN